MQKISCFHKEHTAIQICTLTHHKGKHQSHSFTISNQSFKHKRATGELFCFGAMDASIGNRGRARGVRVRGGGREGRGRGRPRTVISDEIRATLVDHVVNHGLTMKEAGQRVQPHLSRYTVASIIRTFRKENR